MKRLRHAVDRSEVCVFCCCAPVVGREERSAIVPGSCEVLRIDVIYWHTHMKGPFGARRSATPGEASAQ